MIGERAEVAIDSAIVIDLGAMTTVVATTTEAMVALTTATDLEMMIAIVDVVMISIAVAMTEIEVMLPTL